MLFSVDGYCGSILTAAALVETFHASISLERRVEPPYRNFFLPRDCEFFLQFILTNASVAPAVAAPYRAFLRECGDEGATSSPESVAVTAHRGLSSGN